LALAEEGGDHRAAIDRGKRFGVTHHAEPARGAGAGVVTTRAHVRTIVAERAAELFGRSLAERAHALIAIAHPDFRDELRLAARRLHLEQ